jgi:uncharacterized protein YutE (UPF0331/DUF86 family)
MELKKRLALFLAEFEHQVSEIDSIYAKIEKRLDFLESKEVSTEMVESTGYWLHNLYCAFEDLFKVVAGFWENDVGTDESFHIHLLKRMQVRIKGIRPALLSKDSFENLNELRGFRHVFRHAYSYGLDDQRVLTLLRHVLSKKDIIMKDFRKFQDDIASIE